MNIRIYDPLPGYKVGNRFGPRPSFPLPGGGRTIPFHYGDDKPAPIGTPVRAMHDGRVVYSGWDDGSVRIWPGLPKGYSYGGGWMVAIQNGPITTWYMHHRAASPYRVGDWVKARAIIAYVGVTGATTGAHSHYETWKDGRPVAPSSLIGKTIQTGKPKPPPKPEPIQEEEDEMKPVIIHRTEGPDEWSLVSPEIGHDLEPGQTRREGGVTTFRGFMATTDQNVAKAWARTWGRGFGEGLYTASVNRKDYMEIQKQATRLSVEFAK